MEHALKNSKKCSIFEIKVFFLATLKTSKIRIRIKIRMGIAIITFNDNDVYTNSHLFKEGKPITGL